jgi:hypothetical protein
LIGEEVAVDSVEEGVDTGVEGEATMRNVEKRHDH